MLTKNQKQLVEDYVQAIKNRDNYCKEHRVTKTIDGEFYKGEWKDQVFTTEEEYCEYQDRIYKLNQAIDDLYQKIAKIKVEIQHPETIIGARAITGYRGKLCAIYCNDLLHIALSEVKSKGIVNMPYVFDLDGNATKTNSCYAYELQRVDGKVMVSAYLIIGNNFKEENNE